jgi:hypothetical protein
MVLQLDGKPTMKEVGFLLILVDIVGPILGEGVEQAYIVIHGMVPLLQVKELLQLVAEQTHRGIMTTEGSAELTPWNSFSLWRSKPVEGL